MPSMLKMRHSAFWLTPSAFHCGSTITARRPRAGNQRAFMQLFSGYGDSTAEVKRRNVPRSSFELLLGRLAAGVEQFDLAMLEAEIRRRLVGVELVAVGDDVIVDRRPVIPASRLCRSGPAADGCSPAVGQRSPTPDPTRTDAPRDCCRARSCALPSRASSGGSVLASVRTIDEERVGTTWKVNESAAFCTEWQCAWVERSACIRRYSLRLARVAARCMLRAQSQLKTRDRE